MKAFGQFVVKLADLLEAEGRALRSAVFRLSGAILLLILTALLVAAAIGLFAGALYLVFAQLTGSAAAGLAILGGIGLLIALLVRGPGARR